MISGTKSGYCDNKKLPTSGVYVQRNNPTDYWLIFARKKLNGRFCIVWCSFLCQPWAGASFQPS